MIITLSLPYNQFSVAWVGAPGARAQSLTRPDRARLLSPDTTSTPIPPPPPESSLGSVRLATPPPERDLARCCRCSPLKDADRSVLNAEADTGRFLILPFSHLIRKIEERTVPFFPTTRFLLFSHPPLSLFFNGNVEVSNISVQWEISVFRVFR